MMVAVAACEAEGGDQDGGDNEKTQGLSPLDERALPSMANRGRGGHYRALRGRISSVGLEQDEHDCSTNTTRVSKDRRA